MKKIVCLTAIALTLLMTGCAGNDKAAPQATPNIPGDVADVVSGESQTAEVGTVLNEKLNAAIKKVNENAVVSESLAAGDKMLSITLPKSSEKVAEDFVRQVADIIRSAKLGTADEYDFYYFSANDGESVLVYATFEEEDDKLKLISTVAIDSSYASALETATKNSSVFK